MVGSGPADLGSNPGGATLIVSDSSVAPSLRVNGCTAFICSVHANPRISCLMIILFLGSGGGYFDIFCF